MTLNPNHNFLKSLLLLFISIIFALTIYYIKPHAEEKQMNEYTLIVETMTHHEFCELMSVMYLECRDQPFDGKVAVAEVIFNRVNSDYFPDTVHDVLSQTGQFSTWHNIDKVKTMQETGKKEALHEIGEAIIYAYEHGRTILPSDNYIYFDTKGKNGHNHIHIGGHYFGEMK